MSSTIQNGSFADLGAMARRRGRGASKAQLMDESGLSEASLDAIMSCDLFQGLARDEAKRLADGLS